MRINIFKNLLMDSSNQETATFFKQTQLKTAEACSVHEKTVKRITAEGKKSFFVSQTAFRSHLCYIYPLPIDNYLINWSSYIKCFSITIWRKLNFIQYVNNITKNATQNCRILYPILNRTSPIPMKNRLNLLKLYIISNLTYAGAS